MRDYRKYCRPKVQKNPKIGDVRVKLNCGEILTVSALDYKKVGKNFKLDSFIGESPNTAGNLLVTNKILNQDMVLSPLDYINNSDRFEIKEIIGDSTSDAQEGDIICHNSLLNIDAVFSFNDWTNNVSDDWDLIGLYGITTYEEEDASDGDYVIMANGHTLIISPSDYDKVSSNWEYVDNIVKTDVNEYEYVDLGLPSGTLWAKYNVGATSETEYGNYYQYGKGADDYSVTNGQSDYDGEEDPLAASADTATQVWGGSWHMPTSAQCQELVDNTVYSWEEDFNGSGVDGGKFTASNGNYVFFPAAGFYLSGIIQYEYVEFDIWCSTPTDNNAYLMYFGNDGEDITEGERRCGNSVRPVIG